MPVPPFEGEPRGNNWDEPRDDDLNWNEEIGEWFSPQLDRHICGGQRKGINKRRREEMGDDFYPLRCSSPFTMLNGRCKKHAGAMKRGAKNAQFKNGAHSRFMPKHIYERFEENHNDPELGRMQFESALLRTRIEELLSELPGESSNNLWEACCKQIARVDKAFLNGSDDLGEEIDTLRTLIEEGSEAQETWGVVLKTIETRRKVVAEENKRTFREKNTITYEQALILVHSVVHACSEVLDKHRVNPEVRDEIANAIVRITNTRNIPRVALKEAAG